MSKNYKDEQRKRAAEVFNDEEKLLLLKDRKSNLWKEIQKEAVDYFNDPSRKIKWWQYSESTTKYPTPTGHLLSSQIACINHLYPLMKRGNLAAALLKGIDGRIKEAVKLDEGFVDFEVIGKEDYLNESKGKKRERGAKVTSLDAIMVGQKENGKNVLFLFEWKYTELPKNKFDEKKLEERSNRGYTDILLKQKSIQKTDSKEECEQFYREKYYQQMRQTLLALKMVEAGEYNCDEFIHLHVIPEQNEAWKEVCNAWKELLVKPEKYEVISPEKLFKPIENEKEISELIKYLKKRYWEK